MKTMNRGKNLTLNAAILAYLLLSLSPLLITLSNALRSPDNMKSPFLLFQEMSFQSLAIAFQKIGFVSAFCNSVLITTTAVLTIIIVASMAAYPLSRLDTRLSRFLALFFLAGIIVSAQIAIIPIYKVFKTIQLNHSRLAPILMYVSGSMPFSIFLYTQFIRGSIPVALEEAALMDGAGLFSRYWNVILPLLLPATLAIVFTQGVAIWNDFFMPMLFITEQVKKPLTLAMLGFMGDVENPTQWNVLFAACYLCTIPLLIAYAALQKYFISGLVIGGVKG
ncbi:carbohydrate ABC transporter membrane protein 2 (CUT1 family) [Hydrogenispora ethanolica]|jgi:raffinose/stachyose/melibiose transport system permease protein|uniref:Carbohydrate ABC transporter membrane protein 2 (CUT1 family) n=1 Tax=Hydrogenispora ethanolica TaxID=1082276 RepID=A0A4R1R8K5_HYDET|nr:carbohydrate ABC transporter permease [Hydrogenispora ethanolica]TCL61991.1 carbohydrate ABC transporter membrane protein 2 (CUT1 family) [Hydrogenispora ethanolica]